MSWTFEASRPGPHLVIQALTHGNEVCGAIALDWLLRESIRPVRGTLTVVFANVAAYLRFDALRPFASRCVDEDFNRLWTPEVLDGPRDSGELRRARELRPLYERRRFPARPPFDVGALSASGNGGAPPQGRRTGARAGDARAHRRRRGACGRPPLARLLVLRRRGRSAQRVADRMRAALGSRRTRTSHARRSLRFLRHFGMVRRCVAGPRARRPPRPAATGCRGHRDRDHRQRRLPLYARRYTACRRSLAPAPSMPTMAEPKSRHRTTTAC